MMEGHGHGDGSLLLLLLHFLGAGNMKRGKCFWPPSDVVCVCVFASGGERGVLIVW